MIKSSCDPVLCRPFGSLRRSGFCGILRPVDLSELRNGSLREFLFNMRLPTPGQRSLDLPGLRGGKYRELLFQLRRKET